MNSSSTTMVDQYRTPVAASLLNTPGWKQSDYSLKPVANWSSEKVQLIAATHKEGRNGPFPFFAILSEGTIVSNYDKDAFQTIVSKAFPAITAADAPWIARLGVLFGAFAPTVVGEFSDQVPNQSGVTAPRKSADVSYEASGVVHTLLFYANDFELNIPYDCKIQIANGVIQSTATRLTKQVADSEAN